MKALILNSGLGSRMGEVTNTHPKCMTELFEGETILSRQLKRLVFAGINDVIITTGYFDKVLTEYCYSLNLDINYEFVYNPRYAETNYIYSMYLAGKYAQDDILLMHGDLVFTDEVLNQLMSRKESCIPVSSTVPLPEKDFKAVVNGKQVLKIGIEFFENALASQPLYKLNKIDWLIWLNKINEFCTLGKTSCYAENAFNEVAESFILLAVDIENQLCNEIDNMEDLKKIKNRIMEMEA